MATDTDPNNYVNHNSFKIYTKEYLYKEKALYPFGAFFDFELDAKLCDYDYYHKKQTIAYIKIHDGRCIVTKTNYAYCDWDELWDKCIDKLRDDWYDDLIGLRTRDTKVVYGRFSLHD